MIEIKPIELGLPRKTGVKILIRPIIASTTDTSCNTYFEVQDENGQILTNGNVPITEEQYAGWGEDNAYLENIVLNELGLERL